MPRLATKQINFRVTDDELMVLEEYAGRAGLKLPAYCKKAALKVKVRPQNIDKEVGKEIIRHLSHMGGNLNQLAKRANEGGTVAAAEIAEIKAGIDNLWDYLLTGKKPEKTEMKKENEKEQKPEISFPSPSSEAAKPPHCKLCGAEMVEGKKKDSTPIWFCPNWENQEKGTHTVVKRE